jgi:hypothetical protein
MAHYPRHGWNETHTIPKQIQVPHLMVGTGTRLLPPASIFALLLEISRSQ